KPGIHLASCFGGVKVRRRRAWRNRCNESRQALTSTLFASLEGPRLPRSILPHRQRRQLRLAPDKCWPSIKGYGDLRLAQGLRSPVAGSPKAACSGTGVKESPGSDWRQNRDFFSGPQEERYSLYSSFVWSSLDQTLASYLAAGPVSVRYPTLGADCAPLLRPGPVAGAGRKGWGFLFFLKYIFP